MAASVAETARNAAFLTLKVSPRLSRWIQTQMNADDDHDISIRQLTALQFISDSETTLGDVARSLNVTPAVVTGLIDRLERRGYVRRIGSMFDRRRVHIELTTAGEDVRDHAEDRLASELEQRVARLSQDEITTMFKGLKVLDKVLTSIDQERLPRSS